MTSGSPIKREPPQAGHKEIKSVFNGVVKNKQIE